MMIQKQNQKQNQRQKQRQKRQRRMYNITIIDNWIGQSNP